MCNFIDYFSSQLQDNNGLPKSRFGLTCQSMYRTTGVVLVTVARSGIADVQIAVAQHHIFAPNVRVRVDVDVVVLNPWRHDDVVRHVVRYFTFQHGGVAAYYVGVVHLDVVFLLHHYNEIVLLG